MKQTTDTVTGPGVPNAGVVARTSDEEMLCTWVASTPPNATVGCPPQFPT